MAYDAAKPAAGSALVSADIRENFRALKDDQIVLAKERGQQNIENLSFAATVGSNALTVALKGMDGNNCSATNVATIAFRSATLTDGKPVFRTVVAALSVVLSAGSTLGFTAALAGRIYVWAIDNAGTVELALSRTADIFPESNLVSTTAEGGAGAADSATVMYSTTARSSVACRCLGYIEITTGATAGNWSNAPTKIQVMGPGVQRTGNIVQVVNTTITTHATGTTAIPADGTIPQNTEGDQYMTLAITPKSAANRLLIIVDFYGQHSAAGAQITTALFQDTTAGAIAAALQFGDNAAGSASRKLGLIHYMVAGTIIETTFKVRAGAAAGATFTFNGYAGAAMYGGVSVASITIIEIAA